MSEELFKMLSDHPLASGVVNEIFNTTLIFLFLMNSFLYLEFIKFSLYPWVFFLFVLFFMVGSEIPYIYCYFCFVCSLEPKSCVGIPLVIVALQMLQGKDSWRLSASWMHIFTEAVMLFAFLMSRRTQTFNSWDTE